MNDKNENLVLEYLRAIRGTLKTQEQLPTTVWIQEIEQRRSSCRRLYGYRR